MKRAKVLQGLRQMKFEEILERAKRRRLSQSEAASILGMSERTFRRSYRAGGVALRRKARRVCMTAGWARSRGTGCRWTR